MIKFILLRLLHCNMVSAYQTDEDGNHICPNCGTAYEPDFDSKEKAKKYADEKYQIEQYITGLCSDDCWDDYLGL